VIKSSAANVEFQIEKSTRHNTDTTTAAPCAVGHYVLQSHFHL